MTPEITADIQYKYFLWRACCWASIGMVVGYGFFWAFMGFNLPPFEPSIPLADLYAHYTDNSVRIRIGQTMGVFFGGWYMIYATVMAQMILEVKGQHTKILSSLCQVGGGLTAILALICGCCWLTAAFRVEERTPEIVRMLHDLGWMLFDTTYIVITIHMVAAALAFLNDKREVPLIPRWLCWYTLFVMMTFFPLTLLPFFYSGPFAWSGLFDYWVSLGTWFIWIVLMAAFMLKATYRLQQEALAK